MAIYSGRASDFPVGSPLSQLQPLDAFVFAGPGNKPSANLTETLIPGRQPYQLSNRQDAIIDAIVFPTALISEVKPPKIMPQHRRGGGNSFKVVKHSVGERVSL